MRILHTSDLHGNYKPLLVALATWDYDVWVDTGDFFPNKTRGVVPTEREYQYRWFFQYKDMGKRLRDALGDHPMVGVPGNHCYQHLAKFMARAGAQACPILPGQTAHVYGKTFAGFREIPWIAGEWAGETDDFSGVIQGALDSNPDVLLTHAPPNGILDGPNGYGIPALTSALMYGQHNIKCHLFGHAHDDGGNTVVQGGITFHNAATTMEVVDVDLD